jgi:hypothetical protein
MAEDPQLVKERLTLRTVVFSLLAFIAGIGAMLVAHAIEESHRLTADLLDEMGAALWVSVALAMFWDLAGKRAFADEIIAKVGMSRSLARAGIETVANSFQEVAWKPLFKATRRLDIFVAYGATWRNSHVADIGEFLANPESALRVLLPDPGVVTVMTSLAARFAKTPEEMQSEVEEAQEFFMREKGKAKGSVEIYLTSAVPLFSFYVLDTKAVLALYNHRLGRIPVPTFVCDRDGFLFAYLTAEFEGLRTDANRTKRISD